VHIIALNIEASLEGQACRCQEIKKQNVVECLTRKQVGTKTKPVEKPCFG
jgi:hypothetical protein